MSTIEHTAHDCACTDGTETVTVRTDAASAYAGLAIHAWKQPISRTYQEKLRAIEGCVVAVSHVFRGPTGLSYAYSAAGLHLPCILTEEQL